MANRFGVEVTKDVERSNADAYPSLVKVLKKIAQEEDLPAGQIEHIEVHCFASGEASCRVWAPRAEEPETAYWNEV